MACSKCTNNNNRRGGASRTQPPLLFFWKIRGNSSQQARKSTLKFEFRLANTRACIREATTIIESREFNHVNLYRSKVIHVSLFSLGTFNTNLEPSKPRGNKSLLVASALLVKPVSRELCKVRVGCLEQMIRHSLNEKLSPHHLKSYGVFEALETCSRVASN